MNRSRPSRHLPSPTTLGGIVAALAILVTVVLLAGTAQAQPPFGGPGGGGPEGPGGHHGGPHGLLGIDTDQDGVITTAEIDAFLIALDANADGTVTDEEFEAYGDARAAEAGIERRDRPRAGQRRARHFDADGDGQILTSEIRSQILSRDANGDGEITRDEMGPRHRMRHRGPGGHGGHGGHGPGPGAMTLRAADANDDHIVTSDEWDAFLGTVDADGDGQVTMQEVHAVADPDFEPPSRSIDEVAAAFAELDANGDGQITEDELPRHGRFGMRGPGPDGPDGN